MNMIGAHVGRQEHPVLPIAAKANRFQYHITPSSIHSVRGLLHPITLCQDARIAGPDEWTTRQIMSSVHGASLLAVKMAAVAANVMRYVTE